MRVINVHGHLGRNLLSTSLRHHYTADEVVRLMDEAGIDLSIVFPPIWVGGETLDPNYEQANAEIVEAVRKYPSTSSTMKCNTWARGVSAVRCGDDAQTLPTLVCG